jgi:hypothetical protein
MQFVLPDKLNKLHTALMLKNISSYITLRDTTYSQYVPDEGRNLLCKIGKQVPDYKASYSRKRIFKESSA